MGEDSYPLEDEQLNKKENKKDLMKKKKKVSFWQYFETKWILLVLLMSFGFAILFSIISEILLNDASLILVIIVLSVLLFLNITFDIIAIAVASASLEPFIAMNSKKVRGAKQAIVLLKNANKVSSFCADIMGDICGVISGAAGGAAVIALAIQEGTHEAMIASIIISGIIACFTITGKAIFKRFAMMKSTSIVMTVGKIISIFYNPKNKKQKNKK